jgi:NAD(P)H-hydrate epimerase
MQSELVLSRNQVRRIDELAKSQYGLPGIVLMENAGHGAAQIIDQQYSPRGIAFVACGTGNNGGDGLVIARHLHNAGWTVQVVIAGDPVSMSPDCAVNDRVIQAMGVERSVAGDTEELLPCCEAIRADTVVVDALLGTGFQGMVRPALAAFIDRLNVCPRRAMLAVDVPSGLNCDTGLPGGTAIRADTTITFVAMKPGFLTDSGRRHTGRCRVAGIGVPRELIERVARLEDPCGESS